MSGGKAQEDHARHDQQVPGEERHEIDAHAGARHFMMPTMSSTAAAIEATSMKESRSQMSAPIPACSEVASGGT